MDDFIELEQRINLFILTMYIEMLILLSSGIYPHLHRWKGDERGQFPTIRKTPQTLVLEMRSSYK